MAGPSEYQVALLVAIGTVGMLLLAIAIVLFVVFYQKRMIQEQYKRQVLELSYQQKMMEAALESQEQERSRLAGELHDSIGAMLSTIRVGLLTLARQMPDPQVFEHPKEMLDLTIASVRSISRELMPSTLDKFGFLHAVKELCDQVESTSLLPINCVYQGEVRSLDKNRELMLFRIVQELLNNALKHAKASEIIVNIAGVDSLIVTVEDNGVGFDHEAVKNSSQQSKGLGLFNIDNRARLLGATLNFDKDRSLGTKITLDVPYEKI
jgi:signal transduction histidine kinase